jgi:hypothetical protein
VSTYKLSSLYMSLILMFVHELNINVNLFKVHAVVYKSLLFLNSLTQTLIWQQLLLIFTFSNSSDTTFIYFDERLLYGVILSNLHLVFLHENYKHIHFDLNFDILVSRLLTYRMFCWSLYSFYLFDMI